MRMRPTAIGIEVVPTEKLVIIASTAGKKYPIPILTAMARKISSVQVPVKESESVHYSHLISHPGVSLKRYGIAYISPAAHLLIDDFFHLIGK